MSNIETTIRTTNTVHEITTNDTRWMCNLYEAMSEAPEAVIEMEVRDGVLHAVLNKELIEITVEPPEEEETENDTL